LLTADSSYDLFKYNTHIHRILLFEKDRAKREWWSNPRWVLSHIYSLMQEIRKVHYELAIDLQGRFKSVIFLYTAKAHRKFVKGRWPFLQYFKKPEIHAIEEMDYVLREAGVQVSNSAMEIFTSECEKSVIQALVHRINPAQKNMIIISPFTRWDTKNWGREKFRTLLQSLPRDILVIFTGAADRKDDINKLIFGVPSPETVNLAGELTVLEFAELMKQVALVLTGDSFPMHLASALETPLIALFGPTDERRIGPLSHTSIVLRANDDCERCYRRDHCAQNCIGSITPEVVLEKVTNLLALPR
jgi:ADP-heptose:LPS heptosyltransferase